MYGRMDDERNRCVDRSIAGAWASMTLPLVGWLGWLLVGLLTCVSVRVLFVCVPPTQVEQFCFWVYTQQHYLTYFEVVHDGMPFWVVKVPFF